jgi:tetratricopeptide (TPR) repeat protein
MRASEKDLQQVGPLLEEGKLEELRGLVRALWPPDASWDSGDVELLATFLLAAWGRFGESALPLYEPYAKRLRSAKAEFPWLFSFPLRAEVITQYEGFDRAMEWLREAAGVIPPPSDGVVDLVQGRLLRARGEHAAARAHLGRAVQRSLQGINWYRLEALNEMALCLAYLGERRLAFEYYRTHAIESYKLGRIENASGLYNVIYNLSLVFGQLDYTIDVKGNLARNASSAGSPTHAALEMSDAGFRLGQLGLRAEAAAVLEKAARFADRGAHPGDPAFAVVCRLLARYLAPPALGAGEMDGLLEAAASRLSSGGLDLAAAAAVLIRHGAAPGDRTVDDWRAACAKYAARASLSSVDARSALILNHLAALLARFYREAGRGGAAEAFYEVVTSSEGPRDAIFLFAREDHAMHLLRSGRAREALAVCRPLLERPPKFPHERFLFRQLAAQARLALEDRRGAYELASAALSDWKRVLEGLYEERHKIAWLARGGTCLSCAIEAIREAAEWMPEPQRRRELFRLTELGKARLVADMVSHTGRIPGVYLLPSTVARGDNLLSGAMTGDWFVPILLQGSSFADGLQTFYYDELGRSTSLAVREVEALRGVIHLPVSEEKRLYATADSLSFEEEPDRASEDLVADLFAMFGSRGKST